MTLYGEKDRALRPVLQIAMPRWPRIYAPGGTMHVVARCNNREFYLAAQVRLPGRTQATHWFSSRYDPKVRYLPALNPLFYGRNQPRKKLLAPVP